MIATILYTFLICHIGGPGTEQQAQPVLDQFLRKIETQLALQPQAISGIYTTEIKRCAAYLDEKKPAWMLFDFATYLKFQRSRKLTPRGVFGSDTSYHVVVREGAYRSLFDLKGKMMVSPWNADDPFLRNVVFSQSEFPTNDLKIQVNARSLYGVRRVARGQADAALIDEAAFQHLKQLELEVPLSSIYRSSALPSLVLVTGHHASKSNVVERFIESLLRLCDGNTEALCRSVQVERFSKIKPDRFREFETRYWK